MRILYILLFSLFGIIASVQAQFREAGTWKYYINNSEFFDLENVNGNLFVNAKRLLFDVGVQPIDVSEYNKVNGLSDYTISTIAFHEPAQKLFIIYENSMIDVMSFHNGNKSIRPNFDLYNKLVVADKTISQVKFFRDRAYLCSGLGIIVMNYDKNEIEENYVIGDGGQFLGVNTLEIVDNKIYASTDIGIKEAEILPAINLQDYSNWSSPLASFPTDTFIKSSHLDSKTYWLSDSRFCKFDGSNVEILIEPDTLRAMVNLRRIGNDLYVVYDSLRTDKSFHSSKVLKYDGSSFELVKETNGRRLFDMNIINNEYFFVGNGFYQNLAGNDLKHDRLNSYPFDFPFRMQLQNNGLYVNMGVMATNLDASLNKGGHYTYKVESWSNGIPAWGHRGIWDDSLSDCTNQIAAIERDGGLYRAFVRGGVAFQKEGSPVTRFRSNNSSLETGDTVYRISDMVYNPLDQSIWIANSSSSEPLKCLTKDGVWHSFDLSLVTNTTSIYRIVIDQTGNKWLLTRQDGVILFNEQDITDNTDDIIRQILEIKNDNCTLDVRRPFSAMVDNDNNLWIGSEKGVGSISGCTYDPSRDCDMTVPVQQIVNPNDTTEYTECVFLNTAVTALAVDPGNRLWVGTPDGVFYNDEYLSSEFIKLNKLNSPFSVKSVHDILVHPESGEVFFTTEVGLLSYMGQSSSAEINEGLSPYRIIPNPVPRDYTGLVTIDGLPDGGYYKITDVIGNVMYQGHANGSRVTWDTRSLNGYKVPTGVYYIFSSKAELQGEQGVATFTIVR